MKPTSPEQEGLSVKKSTEGQREYIALLIERLLQAATAQHAEEMHRVIATLRAECGPLPSLVLLEQRMTSSQRWVTPVSGVFYVGEGAPSATFSNDMQAAIGAASALLALQPPSILVNCTGLVQGLYLTHCELPGYYLITFSTSSGNFPDRLRSTIFHEVGHCFLTCGCKLLDEGFAVWFSRRHSGVAPRKHNDKVLPLSRSVRSLLIGSKAEGIHFERLGVTLAELPSVKDKGAELVEAILAHSRVEGLKSLFAEIAASETGDDVARAVEAALGKPLECFDATDSRPMTSPTASITTPVDVAPAIAAVWAEKSPANRARIQSLIESLGANPSNTRGWLESMARLRMADLGVSLFLGESVSDDVFTTVDALLAQATERKIDECRLLLLRGHRAMLTVLQAKTNKALWVKGITAIPQAIDAYTRALQAAPHDAEALINLSLLEVNIPARFGNKLPLAKERLSEAANDPIWGRWAQNILATTPAFSEAAKKSAAPDPAPAAAATAPVVASPAVATPVAPAVEIRALRVRISDDFELAPTDLSFPPGQRVALIGHNGAGKSMLIESLLGLRKPRSGSARVLGLDTAELRRNPAVRAKLGALLQHVLFPSQMRVSEIVGMHEAVYGMQSARLIHILGLEELMKKSHRALSRGQRQRLLLYVAMAHRPQLLFLDEPTLGLDENYARALRDHWQGDELKGSTLFIASHIPADLAIVDRVVCLKAGTVMDDGSLRELMDKHVSQFCGRIMQPLSETMEKELRQLPGVVRLPAAKDNEQVVYGDARFRDAFRGYLTTHQISAFGLRPSQPDDFLAQVSTT